MSDKFNPFVSSDLIKIKVKGDQYVEVIEAISHDDLQKAIIDGDVGLLKFSIKNWNFTNLKNEAIPCTPENISKLNSKIVTPLASKCLKLYMPEKKILMESMEELLEDTLKDTEEQN